MAIITTKKNSAEEELVKEVLYPLLEDYPKATKPNSHYKLKEFSICNGYMKTQGEKVPEIFGKLGFENALELTRNILELALIKYDVKMVRTMPEITFRSFGANEYPVIFLRIYYKENENLSKIEDKLYNGGKEDMDNFVTSERIEKKIEKIDYTRMGEKTTICFVKLKNGFEVVGVSACVDPKNFNEKQGKYYSYKDAIDQIEKLEGYKLQDELLEVKS